MKSRTIKTITLSEPELHEAVRQYVARHIPTEDTLIHIYGNKFGGNGSTYAEVVITLDEESL